MPIGMSGIRELHAVAALGKFHALPRATIHSRVWSMGSHDGDRRARPTGASLSHLLLDLMDLAASVHNNKALVSLAVLQL